MRFCGQCAAPLASLCPSCGTANPPHHKFCGQCAVPLAKAAEPRFGSPTAYTPKHLAEKILTSKTALEGERKQVTVLFVDASGFTAMASRLDPEEVHGLMNRAFELMLAEVHRYEGTVNQFLGDGIMALFGAPVAHEDHAQRAVHAALGIRKALEAYRDELRRERGIDFQVRQGLNTGLVVVGSIGSDLRMDYTAVGDTTNVAARLQQAADRGRIVVSEATHRLIDGYFHTRPLGRLALKGKAESVPAWEVIAARQARSRLDLGAERGLTPYVGRERELSTLFEGFEKVAGGQGQVVFVVGDPGIGKSRLLYEFRRRLGDRATWLEGRCISFGQSIALHPVIDMLKRNFRIEEADGEDAVAQKIERSVLRLGEDLQPIIPYLRSLLSVDPGEPTVRAMDPQRRRGETFDALRRLLVRASEVRPQVFVLEDIHWMDRATEESLLFSADSIPTSRILQILTYRTGYRHPFGERTYHTRILLTALPAEHTVRVAEGVLGAQHLPPDLATLIIGKAEGNPFYIEEVVKSLQEVGALRREGGRYALARRLDEILIPDSIQDVIMARIDRLEEAPKKTLQLASVIGREFTRRLLDRIADIRDRTEEFLGELKAIELIYEKALFPELAYMFKHALTHDVAYHSLLVQRRKELHRLIGLGIEELYADRLAEHYEVLAHHFSKAEDWAKALEYLLKAMEKATRTFANREALALSDQALGATQRLGDAVGVGTVIALRQTRASLLLALSDFAGARAEAETLLDLARQAGDRRAEAAALGTVGNAAFWAHDFEQALADSGRAIAFAEAISAGPVLAAGHFTTGAIYAVTARLEAAREELSRVLAISQVADDVFHRVLSLGFLGQLRNWAGEYDEALRLTAEALRVAREHNLFLPIIWTTWHNSLPMIATGDYDQAAALLAENLALCEKAGDEVFHHRNLNTLGWLCIEVGDLERAIDLNRRCAEGARKRRDHECQANAEINVADALLAKGDLLLAGEVLDGVHRLVKDPATSEFMRWRYSTHLFASLGELWVARGDPDRARGFAEQCLALATHSRARKYLIKGWRLEAEIAAAHRQWEDADRALREAVAAAGQLGSPTQLWKTHLARGRLAEARGQREDARRAYRAAREVLDRVRSRLETPALRTAFECAPFVRTIHDLVNV
jgi:class 3 adenylate cyclase/tetratricopeptide (TPR) repeat protein